MSWFDAAAVVVVLLAVLDGATSGVRWALLELLVLVGSALAARALRPFSEPYVAKIAGIPESDLPWLTHLLVFALCAGLLFGVLVLVHPATKRKRLRSAADRWAGGLLGLVTGSLAALLLLAIVLGARAPAWETQARASRLVPVVARLADGPAAALLPDHAGPRARELAPR